MADIHPYPPRGQRLLITGSIMLSSMIVALDMTIANVALPHMQSSLSASTEQVIWVLTSYLLAAAIMTPLASWLASRFGRKRVMVVSAGMFTLSSLACGLAGNLESMVLARLIQGLSGAGLIPLGQATLMEINRPEKQGQAMALAGLGAMLGPLAGPSLGGWLTDNMSWRWVFLINIPIGLMALAGLLMYMRESRDSGMAKFDWVGFTTISIFLGTFQLLLDRGQHLDWFDSAEIWIETALFVLSGYLGLVHMLTRKNTFVRAALFTDRNYAFGCVVSTVTGVMFFATVPALTIMLQSQLGYSPLQTGLIGLPRGIGTVLGLLVVGQLMNWIELKVLLLAGLGLLTISLWIYSDLSLQTDARPVLIAGLIQGMASGLIIAPLSTLTLTTLPANFRNEGTAIYVLARSIGSSLGISALQMMAVRNTMSVSGRLTEGVRPDNPWLAFAMPDLDFDSAAPLAMMVRQIGRQAAMVATIDSMWLVCLVCFATFPVVMLMKGGRIGSAAGQANPALEVH